MEKKVFNWLGWLIVILYVTLTLVFAMAGIWMDRIGNFFIRNILYSVVFLALLAGAALIPIWYDWALGKLLPCQQDIATVIFKQTAVSHSQDATGPELTFVKRIMTFELIDGTRLVFRVRENLWFTLLMGERGMLTYKQQGKHTYFIGFERFH